MLPGLRAVEPGTQVVCVKDEGAVLLVKAGNLEFEAKRQYFTNDLEVADLAVRNNAEDATSRRVIYRTAAASD